MCPNPAASRGGALIDVKAISIEGGPRVGRVRGVPVSEAKGPWRVEELCARIEAALAG